MTLTLNISPCPNDTFMFDALVNGRIDPRGYEFAVDFADIEELNRRVLSENDSDSVGGHYGKEGAGPDISKISYAILPAIATRYTLLDSGSALGHGNGPVLVARPGDNRRGEFSGASSKTDSDEEVTAAIPGLHTSGNRRGELARTLSGTDRDKVSVAIPGLHTTANLLLQKLFPALTARRPMLFSDIAEAVARGEVDAGVLIHEGRFTWREHGLELIADLGAEWDRTTGGLPLPLGAIVASRKLPPEVVRDVEELIRRSIEYAFAHPSASREFIKTHAREMDDTVIDRHIALFVNAHSLTLGPDASRAITTLTGITF